MSAAVAVDHFNPRRDYNHADDQEYKRLRAEADHERGQRASMSAKSQEAYKSGDKAAAKEYSEQAKAHELKMEQLNQRAVDFVFRANNSDSGPDEIDLHGLYVKEAVAVLETRIQACQQRHDSHLDVIVGKGIHSEHGAKIKPAVEELCTKYGFKWALKDHNSGVIVIDFTAPGGQVPLENIAPRPNVASKPQPNFGSRPHTNAANKPTSGYPSQPQPVYQNQPQYNNASQYYGGQQQQQQQQQQQFNQQSSHGNGQMINGISNQQLFGILCQVGRALQKCFA